jgi:uncharacterized protein YndB with AHSA1/START domain
MMTVTRSVVINTPQESVFAYVTDPSRMPEWLPSLMETDGIVGSGEGQQYEWTYKLAGILFHGEAVVVEHVLNELSVHQSIGAIHSTWTFRVEPERDATRLTLEIVYEVPLPVLGKLAERVIATRDARAIETALANAKEALEA